MNEKQTEIDWEKMFEEDKRLKHWLNNRPANTVRMYKVPWRLYYTFRGLTPDEAIDEKWEDMKKKPQDQGKVEDEIRSFYKWLTTEYKITKGKRKGEHLSAGSAVDYISAILDFYARHNLRLNIKLSKEFKQGMTGRPVNESEKMSPEQIDQLAYYAPSLRDKAFIWVQFQSGSDVSTVCKLNYGHVMKEINNPPLEAIKLKGLIRPKEPSKTYISFIYRTAVEHLKRYLEERWGTDYQEKLTWSSPLFTGEGKWKDKRAKPRMFQDMLRQVAMKSALIPKGQLEEADINPLRPHALRASFSDRMAKTGASKLLIDYLMGHKMKYGPAYFGGEEGLREAYVKYAKEALEPTGIESVDESVKKLRSVIEEQATIIAKMKPKLEQLETRMARYEEFTKKFMEMTPEELDEIGKVVERKRRERILKEDRELSAEEQELPEEA